MSATFGRRLYAHLWESAHPYFGRIRQNRAYVLDASPRKVYDAYGTGSRRFSTSPGTKYTPLTRRFASGGFFVLFSPTSAAAETSAACIRSSKPIPTQSLWKRAIHSQKNESSNESSPGNSSPAGDETAQPSQETPNPMTQNLPPKLSQQESHFAKPSNRHLMDRLPHMPHLHRPTKEELLAAATGFWSRLKVRFKWFSIRSVRPFNLDEITALFSWVLLGHVVWVVLGTTTFFSLLILAINTVFAQGMYDQRLSDLDAC